MVGRETAQNFQGGSYSRVEQINDIANRNLQCVLGKHAVIDKITSIYKSEYLVKGMFSMKNEKILEIFFSTKAH